MHIFCDISSPLHCCTGLTNTRDDTLEKFELQDLPTASWAMQYYSILILMKFLESAGDLIEGITEVEKGMESHEELLRDLTSYCAYDVMLNCAMIMAAYGSLDNGEAKIQFLGPYHHNTPLHIVIQSKSVEMMQGFYSDKVTRLNMIYPSYQPYSCTVANRQPESLCSLQSDTQGGIEGEPPAVNSHGLGGSTSWTTKGGPNQGKTFSIATIPIICDKEASKAIWWIVSLFHSFKAHLNPSALDSETDRVFPAIMKFYQSNMLLHFRNYPWIQEVLDHPHCPAFLNAMDSGMKPIQTIYMPNDVPQTVMATHITLLPAYVGIDSNGDLRIAAFCEDEMVVVAITVQH
ncbi:hypothetical protein V8E55_006394 [Tylopilus felleus]